jgi:hypothetical protein
MPKEQRDYLSYLLRLWRNGDRAQSAWRASLEDSLASERQSFASVDDLCAFLRQETGAVVVERDDEGVMEDKRETRRRPPAPVE